MVEVRILSEALDDLKRLHDFIAQHSAQSADLALETINSALKSLAHFPERGRPWEAEFGYRELLVRFGSKGYVIRYRYYEGEVIVVRIWHALEDR